MTSHSENENATGHASRGGRMLRQRADNCSYPHQVSRLSPLQSLQSVNSGRNTHFHKNCQWLSVARFLPAPHPFGGPMWRRGSRLSAWTPGFWKLGELGNSGSQPGEGREAEIHRGSARLAEWRQNRLRGAPIPIGLRKLAMDLPAATLGGTVECVVESWKPGGTELRIQVVGSRLPGLAAPSTAPSGSRVVASS